MKINMKISALFKTLAVLSMLIVFSAVLYACQPAGYPNSQSLPNSEPVFDSGSTSYSGGVERFVDREAGVVCYIFIGSEKGGIDCLPISETLLKR